MQKGGWVYILTNKPHGVLYTGVTAQLAARIHQHRTGKGSEFAAKYRLKMLVYVERHDDIRDAIWREKAIKAWRRAWKIRLIEEANPDWRDFWDDLAFA